KILDYMDRYGTGADIDDPELELGDGDDEDALVASAPHRYEPVGYAETKRWFEGSEDTDDDVPDFDEEYPAYPIEIDPTQVEPGPERPSDSSAPVSAPSAFNQTAMAHSPMNAPLESSTLNADDPHQIAAFVATLRSPSAPLPSFATEE
ncbi:hypothetical protein, partial [Streptococcus pyogenes]|uniref:hypothetical protein n=1 Tax=Streptococcus pyogenes TaxID=1314 RepID=UPI00165334B8